MRAGFSIRRSLELREDRLVYYLPERGLVELLRGDLLRLLGCSREERVRILLSRPARVLHFGGDELLGLPLRLCDGGGGGLLEAAELLLEGLSLLEHLSASGLLGLLDPLQRFSVIGGHCIYQLKASRRTSGRPSRWPSPWPS